MWVCIYCGNQNDDNDLFCKKCGASKPGTITNALPKGTKLHKGKYIIEEAIAKGGFGIIYKATQVKLNRSVVIKEFFPDPSIRQGQNAILPANADTKHILREAKILAKLNHPNIVKVYDVFEENSTIYIVMELIEGEPVANLAPMNPNDVLELTRTLIDVLDYIHKKKVLHRDIKPSNIMRTSDPKRKYILIDFGAAMLKQDRTITSMMYTPAYASPEQLMQGKLTERSDIYNLGSTLFYLLTSQLPPSHIDISRTPDIVSQKLTEHDENIPIGLIKLIEASMKIDENERPKDAKALKRILDKYNLPDITLQTSKLLPSGTYDYELRVTQGQRVVLGPYMYFFRNGIVVVEGGVLEILPGANINFEENTSLTVYGTLEADGEEDKKITLRHIGGRTWKGVQVEGADYLLLRNVEILNANYNEYFDVSINNSDYRLRADYSIVVSGASKMEIENLTSNNAIFITDVPDLAIEEIEANLLIIRSSTGRLTNSYISSTFTPCILILNSTIDITSSSFKLDLENRYNLLDYTVFYAYDSEVKTNSVTIATTCLSTRYYYCNVPNSIIKLVDSKMELANPTFNLYSNSGTVPKLFEGSNSKLIVHDLELNF